MQLQQQYDSQQQQFRAQQNQQNQSPSEQRTQPRSSGGAGASMGPDLVSIWRQRPPLASENNPLLGRWLPQAVTVKSLADDGLASLFGPEVMNMAKGMARGVAQANCEQMFGRGPVEFGATTLVGLDRNGRQGVLNRLAYRGNSNRVAALPSDGSSIGVMIFDFNGPDHITAVDSGCTFVRQRRADANVAGTSIDAPSLVERTTSPAPARTSRTVAALSPGSDDAVLSLAAGIMTERDASVRPPATSSSCSRTVPKLYWPGAAFCPRPACRH
jgi:hypothetical protein